MVADWVRDFMCWCGPSGRGSHSNWCSSRSRDSLLLDSSCCTSWFRPLPAASPAQLLHLGNRQVPLLRLCRISAIVSSKLCFIQELLWGQPLGVPCPQSSACGSQLLCFSSVHRKIVIYFRHCAFYCIHHFASVLGNVCSDIS